MRYYVALLHKDDDSDYGVSFPDFPGCISAGSTVTDAVAMAREALRGHIAALMEIGEPIPDPSTLDTIMSDATNLDGIPLMVAWMPPLLPDAVRIDITLPEELLRAIDAVTAREGTNRSSFLTQAARSAMQKA